MKDLEPAALKRIGDIYESIVKEEWFNRNAVTERELLKLIIDQHRTAVEDAPSLSERCVEAARNRFFR